MTIYLDVLIIVNFYIDYLLIILSENICALKAKFWRRLIGAFWSSLFSLIILLPEHSIIFSISTKLICVSSTVFIIYSKRELKKLLKLMFNYILLTYIFAGFMTAISVYINSGFVAINNSAIYLNISPILLIVLTTVIYLLIYIIKRIFAKDSSIESKTVPVELKYGAKTVCVKALVDTGNMLTDPISGDDVILIDDNTFFALTNKSAMLGVTLVNENIKGFRLIPFSSIGHEGLMPAFRADSVKLRTEPELKVERVIIGVSPKPLKSGYNCIIPDFNLA